MPDDDFTVLLEYLAPLKGKAREETLTKAVKIVDDDSEDNNGKSMYFKRPYFKIF